MWNFLFNPRYPRTLLVLFLLFAVAWAFKPVDRSTWLLENVLAVLLVAALVITFRRFPLSNISYTLIFLFLCLHTLGAHYTYSLVPYDRWAKAVTGATLNQWLGFDRNHYDRFVHFAFGLLMAYPIREIFLRIARVRGFWGYYLPLDVTMSFSLLYELIEWGAAVVFGREMGQAYVGAQGDEWDAHKDMALAALGALISMSVVALVNWKFDRNFGTELRDSLTLRDGDLPLGEQKLRELLHPPKTS